MKQKIEGLTGITAKYYSTDNHNNCICDTIFLDFANEAAAEAFWSKIKRGNPGYQIPCVVHHPDYSGKTSINLMVSSAHSNGFRVNSSTPKTYSYLSN